MEKEKEKHKHKGKEGSGPQTEMAFKERVQKAIKAMEAIGIPRDTTKQVLKKLWNVYDANWDFIEAENYRVLADAIFEYQENQNKNQDQVKEAEKRKTPQSFNESEPQLKRLNSATHENRALFRSNCSNSLLDDNGLRNTECKRNERKSPTEYPTRSDVREREVVSLVSPCKDKVEEHVSSSQTYLRASLWDNRTDSSLVSRNESRRAGGEQPLQSATAKRPVSHQNSSRKNGAISVGVSLKEPKVELGEMMVRKNSISKALAEGRVGPSISKEHQLEAPLSVQPLNQCPGVEEDRDDESASISNVGDKTGLCLQLASISENAFSNFEITSSPSGEVSISLSCSCCTGNPSFHMPSLDAVLRLAGERCSKSHKIISSNISLVELMEELCQYFLHISTNPSDDRNFAPMKHLLKNSDSSIGPVGCPRGNQIAVRCSNGQQNGLNDHCIIRSNTKPDCNGERKKEKDQSCPESSNPLAADHVQPHELYFDNKRPPHNLNDISKGEERVKIPVVSQMNNERYPPSFHYISQNTTYQSAYINFSLARIGDEDSCSKCYGNCLTSLIPCACTKETGGVFAYTDDGNLNSEFLDKCISRKSSPKTQYCEDCPLERSKNSFGECKGHISRNFIKECWIKCGCDKQCGNRVVQRGITCDLQVFFTTEGKGWGLRTVADLPKGAFVCEYVGEILTNIELYNRNEESTGNDRHTYPVLLDADWYAEDRLKDEEALCLDATRFGNIARFINHRCVDANLIEIPVEIETPDHHYYHIAFFTRRTVPALEELTWDYGIDFADHNHPIKAFRCQCGSEYCRDISLSMDKNRPTRVPIQR